MRSTAARLSGAIDDKNNDGVDDGFAHIANGELAVVHLGAQVDVNTALDELRKDPAVLYAERNYVLKATAIPDDARFPELYGLHNTGQTGGAPDADIDASEAWDSTVGSADIVVGVIDTGVDYRHEDLAANMWVNPREIADNGIDDDGNGIVDDVHGFNAITGRGDPFDDNRHGTHTAGTIGAVGNNGIGVVGVNWDVRIMALKFLDSNAWGNTADAIRAIDYAVAQKLAGVNLRVLSNSWGGDNFSQALLDAITAAGEADILFVAAAGNSASDTDSYPYFPSAYEASNIVAVAATDEFDGLASFSSFGATSVDLGAPGVRVLSTVPDQGYELMDGTSMATPHVAGVAALVLSVNDTLTVDELKDVLLRSGDPIPALSGVTLTGRRVNAATAVVQAGTPIPRFAMSVAPSRRIIAQQKRATYGIDVRSILGFAGNVALTVTSEPPIDATLAIAPAVTTSPGIATLTITTSQRTVLGSYKLTISGKSGDLMVSRTVTFRVVAPGTLFELNVMPGSEIVQQQNSADFRVALDGVDDFTGTVGLSFSSTPPFPGTAFLVSGAVPVPGATLLDVYSDCTTPPGNYVFTIVGTARGTTASAHGAMTLEPFGTTRLSFPGVDTPRPIPDNSSTGITSAISVTDDIAINELSVTVDITHTSIGDLVVRLVAPDGTQVTLHDRAGGSNDNLRKTFVIGDFAGHASTGLWRLRVSDRARNEIGTLDSWDLNLRGPPRSFPPLAGFDYLANGVSVEFVDLSYGTGCGGGAPIVSWAWGFGDGATSTAQNPQHTYAALGDYLVSLAVTDAEGLSASIQQTVTATRPAPVLSIEGVTRDREHQRFWVDLRWRGATGNRVELFRNAASVAVVRNDGGYRDAFSGQETVYRWAVCEQPGACSNEVTIDFGPNATRQATLSMTIEGKQIVKRIAVLDP